MVSFNIFRRIETHDFFPTVLSHFVPVHIKIIEADFVFIFFIRLGAVVSHRKTSTLNEHHALGSLFSFELVLLRPLDFLGRVRLLVAFDSLDFRDGRCLIPLLVIALGTTDRQGQQQYNSYYPENAHSTWISPKNEKEASYPINTEYYISFRICEK
jgi:hypothetical protein